MVIFMDTTAVAHSASYAKKVAGLGPATDAARRSLSPFGNKKGRWKTNGL